jgi:hypothetical protein
MNLDAFISQIIQPIQSVFEIFVLKLKEAEFEWYCFCY